MFVRVLLPASTTKTFEEGLWKFSLLCEDELAMLGPMNLSGAPRLTMVHGKCGIELKRKNDEMI